MAVTISVEEDLRKAPIFFDKFKSRALARALQKSINRTIAGTKTNSNRRVREFRRLQASEISKDFFSLKKAKQSKLLESIEASLTVSGRPLSLIRFIRGSKEPSQQQGIKIKRRRKLTVEVVPGQRKRMQGAFIAEGKGGTRHVFRRKSPVSLPVAKQATSSLAQLFKDSRFFAPIEADTRARFEQEFRRTLAFELDKLK